MIEIRRTPPEQMRAAHNRVAHLLTPERREVKNLENAIALGQPLPLPWDGEEYQVAPISYRAGLELHRCELQLQHWAKNPPKTVEEVEECEFDLLQTLALFHSLLDPKPAKNPFADAAPEEVGVLLGFFSACLTMQRGRSRFGRASVSQPKTS